MASQLSAATSVPQFHGLRTYSSPRSMVTLPSLRMSKKRSQGIRCDYIGSATNVIMVTTTTLMLFAGRFGLAPSA
ncbi:hypothetical protein L9G74_21710, partial [Shewanella sp. C32]|nr:hypothetical protein [Shewanella electrica]